MKSLKSLNKILKRIAIENNSLKSLRFEAYNDFNELNDNFVKIYKSCADQFLMLLNNNDILIKIHILNEKIDNYDKFREEVENKFIKPIVSKVLNNKLIQKKNEYNSHFDQDLYDLILSISSDIYSSSKDIMFERLENINYQIKYNKIVNNNQLTDLGKQIADKCIKDDLLRFIDDNSDIYIASVDNPTNLADYCNLLKDKDRLNHLYNHFCLDVNAQIEKQAGIYPKNPETKHFICLAIDYIFEHYPNEIKNNLFVPYEKRNSNIDISINIFDTIAIPSIKAINDQWDQIKDILTKNTLSANKKKYIINFQAMPNLQINIIKLQNIHRTLFNTIVLSAKFGSSKKRLLKKIAENRMQIKNIDESIVALYKQINTLKNLCEAYIIKNSAQIEYNIQNVLDIFYVTLKNLEHELDNLEY